MVEIDREGKEPYQNKQLVPVSDIDFQKPWPTIVRPLNGQLEFQGYKAFDPDVPRLALVSNLNKPRSTPLNFDPVRVSEDILHENYTVTEQAVAKLGLQAAYWGFVDKSLLRSTGRMHTSEYQEIGCSPVFKRGSKFYLLGNRFTGRVSGIQYAGDNDMILNMKNRAMVVAGEKVPFAVFGLSGQYERHLDEYVDYRERLDEAGDKAVTDAIFEFSQNENVLGFLRKLIPDVDTVFQNPGQYHSFYFGDLAEAIMKLLPEGMPKEAQKLKDAWQTYLAFYLYETLSIDVSRSLVRNGDFWEALNGLADNTQFIYDSALQALQVIDMQAKSG